MANLYATVAQVGSEQGLEGLFGLVTTEAAALLGVKAAYGVTVGGPADLLLLDAPTPARAIAEIAPAVAGWKGGLKTFERPEARVLFPRTGA
jgi:cytosine deaminase